MHEPNIESRVPRRSSWLCALRRLFVLVGLFSACALLIPGSVLAQAVPSGLISWFKADGNAKDSRGHYNGKIVGGVSYAAGSPGKAFSFDGSTGYISVGDPAALRSDGRDFTIAARVLFASNVSPVGSPSQPVMRTGARDAI